MGRNKDALIVLAEKLTGETCGAVTTKKDALKKIACYYAGQEVKCETIADTIECIAEHCSGGTSGGGGETTPTNECHIKLNKSSLVRDTGNEQIKGDTYNKEGFFNIPPYMTEYGSIGTIFYDYENMQIPTALKNMQDYTLREILLNFYSTYTIGVEVGFRILDDNNNLIEISDALLGDYVIDAYMKKHPSEEITEGVYVGRLIISIVNE